MNKGQITLFVVMALGIVGVAALILYSSGIINEITNAGLPEQVQSAKHTIDSCVESSSKEALNIISLQGGFLAPEDYIPDTTLRIAHWYNKGQDVSPTLDTVKSELSNVMDTALSYCVNYNLDINFTSREPVTKTEIKPDYVLMSVNYPITITVGEKNYRFEDFSAKLNARLGRIYELSRLVVIEQTKHPDSVCLTCLSDIGVTNDVKIAIGARNESLLVTVTDENSKVFNTPYQFRFAMRLL